MSLPAHDNSALAHTPYAGRHRPFTIGVVRLAWDDWFEFDAHRDAELALKTQIFDTADDAFLATDASMAAQEEAATASADWLKARGHPVALPDEPPLKAISRVVQDDLVLMQHDGTAWCLTAASLCFPSSWSLSDKFGRGLDGLHHTVPGWQDKMGRQVSRLFDTMRPGALVWRLNWSLQQGPAYRIPKLETDHRPSWTGTDGAHVRVERQTLTKLPQTGAILFTIKIQLDPFQAFTAHPDGANLAGALADELDALTPDQRAYKGLVSVGPELVAKLRGLQSSVATDSVRPEK